jgi:tetratricopeptide (TPR) repeat protein
MTRSAMRRPWLALFFFFLLASSLAALVLLATPAFAQAIPSPPAGKPAAADEATAKKSFESGLRLYGEGSYAEALIAFEQSYRLGGRASALKNIAQCHRNLKHFVEAYEAYEQMLARHDAQISTADRKAVQQALDELGVLTATVLVDVSEPDAEIEIDGKSAGRSPMSKPKRVAATGGHTFRVSKPGFTRIEQPFTVDSQQNKKIDLKLEVEKTVGHVVVREQSGRDVHVFIDGQDQGSAPWEGDLPAGEHVFEAKSARFASDARKAVVAQKDRLDLALDATALLGRLRITTVPASATIVVDGNTVGTGSWEGELAEGNHRVEVSLPGQTPQTREIALGRGQVIVQEIPIVSAIALSREPVYDGLYGRFSIFGQVGLGNLPSDAVPGKTTDDGGFDGALGATLRVGRSWDWYGLEAVGAFMFEHRDRSYLAPRQNSGDLGFQDQSDAPNAFFGIGPRVTSKDESIRFTFGIAPGLAVRTFSPRRKVGDASSLNPSSSPSGTGNRFVQNQGTTSNNTNNPSDQSYASAGYTTFGFVMDGGILLGSTPGTKLFVGAQAWIDFAPTLVTGPDTLVPLPNDAYARPGRGVTVVDGTQVYVGPVLGLQFGH